MTKLAKHPGGRPTKYNRAILTTTMDYLDNYETFGDIVPTIAGLSQVLELARDTVIDWLNDESKPEFSYMCKRLLTQQESKLVNNGLKGTYNSNVTKLMLSKHGYTDTQDKQGVSVNVTINRGTTDLEVQGQTLTIDND